MTRLTTRPKAARALYGSTTMYSWNNDPFSDPLEKLKAKNATPKKKYPKKKKVL